MKKLITFIASLLLTTGAFAQRTALIIKDTGSSHTTTIMTSALTSNQTVHLPQTTSLIDFKNVWTVKDSTDTIYLTDTTPPATPQFTYHVKAGDIPSAGNAKYVRDWGIAIGLTGSDTALLTDDSLYWQLAVNNHFIGSDGYDGINVTANKFWQISGSMDSLNINVGDSLQVYLYSPTTGLLSILKSVVFIYPRSLIMATNTLQWQTLCATSSITTLPQAVDTMTSGVITSSGVATTLGNIYGWDSLTQASSDRNNAFALTAFVLFTRGMMPYFVSPSNVNSHSTQGAASTAVMNTFVFQRYYNLITY